MTYSTPLVPTRLLGSRSESRASSSCPLKASLSGKLSQARSLLAGDLIVGGPDGRPVRLPSVDGVAVLVNDGAELRWATTNTSNLNIGIAERWWELEKWWSDSQLDDMTIANYITVPELVARDITFSGGFVDCLYSVCIIRCRTLRLSSHTTIVCKNRVPSDLPKGSTDGGTSDGNPGGSGGFFGGGGGGGGDNGDGSANGGNGAPSAATGLPFANLHDALIGDALLVGGGSGGNGEDLARVRTSSLRTLGGAGGGAVILAANEIITGGFNFRIDCSGDNGNDGLPEINFGIGHGGGGGGGGGTVIAVARTGHSNVQPNVNGGRGGGGADGVPTGTNFGSHGGDGGRGFSYVEEAFPTAQTPA